MQAWVCALSNRRGGSAKRNQQVEAIADARKGELDRIPGSESAVASIQAGAAVTMATPGIAEILATKSPAGDVAREGRPPTVASATERPASPGVSTDNREPSPRVALLQEYKAAIGWPVYPEKALDALKLRYATETLPKGYLQQSYPEVTVGKTDQS